MMRTTMTGTPSCTPAATPRREAVDAKTNGSPRMVRQAVRLGFIARSPRVIAQRQNLARCSQPPIQCHAADEVRSGLDSSEQPSAGSMKAVKKYKFNSKKTKHATWKLILPRVKTREAYWSSIRNHVMLGEDVAPPKGFHSKALKASAHSVAVGEQNPKGVGDASPYKQWTLNKGDDKNKYKISTFFPDAWPEDKIQAAILLMDESEDNQVQASFGLTSNDGTTYPSTSLADPPKPS